MSKVQVTMRVGITAIVDFGDEEWEEEGARAIAVDHIDYISMWSPGRDNVSIMEMGRIEATDVVELEEE